MRAHRRSTGGARQTRTGRHTASRSSTQTGSASCSFPTRGRRADAAQPHVTARARASPGVGTGNARSARVPRRRPARPHRRARLGGRHPRGPHLRRTRRRLWTPFCRCCWPSSSTRPAPLGNARGGASIRRCGNRRRFAGVSSAREINYSERKTMKNLIRLKESRTARPVWLAASVVVVALFGAAGIVAEQGNAAPALKADKTSYPPKAAKFKQPKLQHGVLSIKGTKASDKIALRLQAGEPGTLQVDVRDDGSADFYFQRNAIAKIAINSRAGGDLVRIDESNGPFTDTIPTKIDGGDGNDNLAGGSGIETLLGGSGKDSIDGNGGNDLALLGAGNDTFVWDPGDGSDTIEGQAGTDTMRFNGANASEQVDVSANGNRLKFFRVQGNI